MEKLFYKEDVNYILRQVRLDLEKRLHPPANYMKFNADGESLRKDSLYILDHFIEIIENRLKKENEDYMGPEEITEIFSDTDGMKFNFYIPSKYFIKDTTHKELLRFIEENINQIKELSENPDLYSLSQVYTGKVEALKLIKEFIIKKG